MVGVPVICQQVGCTSEIVAANMARISALPSSVLMFQVNAIKSRQKHSSPNKSAAADQSF
jgi:hypothetical protein